MVHMHSLGATLSMGMPRTSLHSLSVVRGKVRTLPSRSKTVRQLTIARPLTAAAIRRRRRGAHQLGAVDDQLGRLVGLRIATSSPPPQLLLKRGHCQRVAVAEQRRPAEEQHETHEDRDERRRVGHCLSSRHASCGLDKHKGTSSRSSDEECAFVDGDGHHRFRSAQRVRKDVDGEALEQESDWKHDVDGLVLERLILASRCKERALGQF
mmetsp:Transcript_38084/g.87157  ORF Transcript_38084/g.87157 Transcript_38084/m.87157 type:complete len:210 (-) Transcript_38084:362-991(-)